MFALTDSDAAGERSLVAVDTVIGNLQVVTPRVDEDSAAALGAVDQAQSVDAEQVAWKLLGYGCLGFLSPI